MTENEMSDLKRRIKELEDTLSRTENNLKAILEATGDGIMVTDEKGNVLLSSNKILENLGLSKSSGIDLQPGDFMKAILANIQEPELFLQKIDLINKSSDTNTDTFRLKNGNIIEWFTKPLIVNSNEKGRVWSYRNITEKLRALEAIEESEKRSQYIFNRSPLGMHSYKVGSNNELILIGANPAADRITGIETQKLIDLPIREAFPSADAQLIERYRKAAHEGEIWEKTDMLYEDEKIKGAYDIIAFQIAPGEIAVMFQDITERKHDRDEIL